MSTCCATDCPHSRKITSRQATVYCWLCSNAAHPGCADLGHVGPRIADRIRDHAGLDWTCPSCLHIKSEMRIFMRQTHLEFQSLAAGFKDLASRFQKTETFFKSMKLISVTPNNNTGPIPNNFLPVADPASPLLLFSPRNPPNAHTTVQLSTISRVAPRSPAPLAGVAPKRLVFVSRLNPDATVKDVAIHLSNKLNVPLTEFSVSKFNFKQKRDISSFKIALSDTLYSKVLDASVWPVHAIVHEFLYKSNPRAGVPLTPSTRPPKT
ncbi:hypothetical protein KR200_003702 [Drosophila serrata]|nr:hypothetical protein KR200_003702 [Drosophila serrata]